MDFVCLSDILMLMYLCEIFPMFLLYLAFYSPTNVFFNERVKFLFVYVDFYFYNQRQLFCSI